MTDQKEGIETPANVNPTGGTNDTESQVMAGVKRAIRTGGDLGRNEKYIQAVLDIEKQAEAIHDKAVREAEELPAQAEKEAMQILENSRKQAQEEAHKVATNPSAQEESARIMSQAEEDVRRMKTSASRQMDMAVGFILDQIAGKE